MLSWKAFHISLLTADVHTCHFDDGFTISLLNLSSQEPRYNLVRGKKCWPPQNIFMGISLHSIRANSLIVLDYRKLKVPQLKSRDCPSIKDQEAEEDKGTIYPYTNCLLVMMLSGGNRFDIPLEKEFNFSLWLASWLDELTANQWEKISGVSWLKVTVV